MVPTMGSPGMGWQHLASCTAMPSEPWMRMAPAGLGLITSGRPDSWSWAWARRRAMITGRRLPRPMSAKMSFLPRTPRSFRKRSQAKVLIWPRVRPWPRRAWLRRRSPRVTDSSCWAFFRKWRIWALWLPVAELAVFRRRQDRAYPLHGEVGRAVATHHDQHAQHDPHRRAGARRRGHPLHRRGAAAAFLRLRHCCLHSEGHVGADRI